MITYSQWKNEAVSETVSPEVEKLIQTTAQDITKTVNDYIDMVGPQRAMPSARPVTPVAKAAIPIQKPGFMQKIGRGLDRFGNNVSSMINAPATGRMPGEPEQPTRMDRLKSRLRSFFMKKESLGAVLPIDELKEMIAEKGVKRLFLVEANFDFSKLNRIITSQLYDFAEKLKQVGPEKSMPPEVGGTTDIGPSIQGTPPAPPEKDVMEMARDAIKGRNPYKRFLKNMQAKSPEEVDIAVRSLLRKMGIRGLKKVAEEIINSGVFPDKIISRLQPKPVEETPPPEQPMPEPAPEEIKKKEPDEEDDETLEYEHDWREPNSKELKLIKNPPHGPMEIMSMLKNLVSNKVNPFDIVNANSHLKILMGQVLRNSGDKELATIAKHL